MLVASIDEHRVVALNAASGEPLWTFTAGGRVSTPPTLHRGLALFGSAVALFGHNLPPTFCAHAPWAGGLNVEFVFRAADLTSCTRRPEYRIDGGSWKTVFPVDGIADSKRAEFRVAVVLADKKPHVIALRAFEANENVGSAQATVK